MALTDALRRTARTMLARDRLEIAEQQARQASGLSSAQSDRLDVLERRVAALAAEVAANSSRVDQLHEMVATADPALTRQIVDAVRSDVQRLVVEVNQVLDDRVATP